MNVEDIIIGDDTFGSSHARSFVLPKAKRLFSDNSEQTEVLKELSAFHIRKY